MKVKAIMKFGLERKTYKIGDIFDLPKGYEHMVGVQVEAFEKKAEPKPEPKAEVKETPVGSVEKAIKKKSFKKKVKRHG